MGENNRCARTHIRNYPSLYGCHRSVYGCQPSVYGYHWSVYECHWVCLVHKCANGVVHRRVNCQLWDTAGQERFCGITRGAFIHIRIHKHTHVCMHKYTHACTNTHMHTQTHACVHKHTHVCTNTRTLYTHKIISIEVCCELMDGWMDG